MKLSKAVEELLVFMLKNPEKFTYKDGKFEHQGISLARKLDRFSVGIYYVLKVDGNMVDAPEEVLKGVFEEIKKYYDNLEKEKVDVLIKAKLRRAAENTVNMYQAQYNNELAFRQLEQERRAHQQEKIDERIGHDNKQNKTPKAGGTFQRTSFKREGHNGGFIGSIFKGES